MYEKVEVNKEAKKVYIVCEGQDTEKRYFDYFKGFSSNIDIIPMPSKDGQSDPCKLKSYAELLFFGNEEEGIAPDYSLSKEYKDEVWFVIDTDRWNEGDKIEELRQFCFSRLDSGIRWIVAQSNPCFELWFYYHFNKMKPNELEVKGCASFKKFINNNIKGGFDCRKMPVEIESAIINSEENFTPVNNQPDLYSTEVFLLAKVILPFVKDQLDKAKGMKLS